MERLAPYDRQIKSAVNSRTLWGMGKQAVDDVLSVWNESHGDDRNLCRTCAHDVFSLLCDVGRDYLETLDIPEPPVEKPIKRKVSTTKKKAKR